MNKIRRRIFEIISIGNRKDIASSVFDIFIVVSIIANLAITFMSTYEELSRFQNVFDIVEQVTCVIFLIEYVLRLLTADFIFEKDKKGIAVLKYVISLSGLIDLLTFLPFFLPFIFPSGIVAFRMLRVIRIFRLFKLTAQYDAFQIIVDVLKEKYNQLISSIALICIFMMASSLIMYNLEHEAQPDQFRNVFSGIWWAVSAFLTVGYGDIYPITTLGRLMGIIIAFLGVGMVAIPTGIISAGFVEYYAKIRRNERIEEERHVRFVVSELDKKHAWVGQRVDKIILPPDIMVASIVRNGKAIRTEKDFTLLAGDVLILGEKEFDGSALFNYRELVIKEENKWVGKAVRDLDISKRELIVSIKRNGKTIIPSGSTVIKKDDILLLFFEDMNA